jgi:hypothetical protein
MDTAHTPAITPRDIKILQLVYAYDTCSADHLCARFFEASPTPGKYGPQVTCYRRIARLRQAGYLTGYRLPSLSGMGSGKLLLGLGPNGRKLLAEYLQLARSELKQLKQVVTPVLGAHHLAVCDVRLAVELACESRPGVSLDWVSERELRNQPIVKVKDPRSQPEGVAAPEIPLIPDGQLSIVLADGAEQAFWLEVDLGTIPSKRMQTKLAGYLALSQHAPILWVVPDQRRLEAIASWALKLSERLQTDPSIFWITTRAEITSQAVLGPIWRVVGGPQAHALIPTQTITAGPLPSIEVGQTRISAAALTLAEGAGWRL